MNIINEIWTSRPQEKATQLSDLPDGVIARIKFYNANKDYTVERFRTVFDDYKKSIFCNQEFVDLCRTINNDDYVVDYINNSHFRNELDIFTPDFDKKRTHHITSYKSDVDVIQVRVLSNNKIVKSYDMSATGMTMQSISTLVDKERNL